MWNNWIGLGLERAHLLEEGFAGANAFHFQFPTERNQELPGQVVVAKYGVAGAAGRVGPNLMAGSATFGCGTKAGGLQGLGWNRLDGPRRATPWRVWKLLRQELATAIGGVRHWNPDRWPACLAVMQERPRRRPLQTLPDRVNRLIAQCQALGMSNI
jgi:hypothetical protein